MCGRFVSATDADGLVRFFVIDERDAEELPPRYNVAPSLPVYAVVRRGDGRVLITARWGLAGRAINARAETAASLPAFRDAFAHRRCLIPADAFYEWQERPGSAKVAHLIRRPDGAPLAFAGLWQAHDDGATCAILTTAANEALAPLHHRMPVILERDAWDAWLDPTARRRDLQALLRPAAPHVLEVHPVGTAVNDVRNDHAGLVAPVDADQVEQLRLL
jgi:putative SOS response-associated peptidase YedK